MTTSVINTTIGESRSMPRLWLEGQKLAVAGIKIGVRYCINVTSALKRVELRPAPDDYTGQTFLVSKRERNNIVYPLMEVRTDLFAEVFEMGSKVFVSIRQGRIIVTASHIASRVAERVKRFLDKLQGKQPLAVVSLFQGGRALNQETHSGLQKSGVSSLIQAGAEREASQFHASLQNGQKPWTSESITKCHLQEINVLNRNIQQCDVLIAGAACLSGGHSGNKKISTSQNASSNGAEFVDFLGWVKAANPGIVMFEKIAGHDKSTASMIIRSVLVSLGYQFSEVSIDGIESGIGRSQLTSVVAFTPDIGIPVDVSELGPLFQNEHCNDDEVESSAQAVAPHIAERIVERVTRFLGKLKSKQPLEAGSLFHGGGILDKALHSGLEKAGVESFVKMAVELEGNFLDTSLRNNPELWKEDSFAINSDIREVNMVAGSVPLLDLAAGGIPCVGASRAGASKNHLSCAEEHSTAGSLFVDFIEWIRASNPGAFVIENVPEYSKSASMMVIRSALTSLGYVLSEIILDGNEMGALEKRRRMCVVGLTPGIGNPFDFGQLTPMREKEARLQDILEDIPLDSDRWKSYSYLADKAERDLADGKGFARQLLDGTAKSCGTIGKDYNKGRSTEPFIRHPVNPELSRLLTPEEHAKVKTVPPAMIHGVAPTTQHQLLGQAVVYVAFEAVGYLIGLTVQGLTKAVEAVSNVVEFVSPAIPSPECFEEEVEVFNQQVERFQTMRLFA
jgi:DNA (cytosine-5)-methyltransferase 1